MTNAMKIASPAMKIFVVLCLTNVSKNLTSELGIVALIFFFFFC